MKFELRSASHAVPTYESHCYEELGFVLGHADVYETDIVEGLVTVEINSIEDLHALHKHFGCPIVYTDDYLEIQNDES